MDQIIDDLVTEAKMPEDVPLFQPEISKRKAKENVAISKVLAISFSYIVLHITCMFAMMHVRE